MRQLQFAVTVTAMVMFHLSDAPGWSSLATVVALLNFMFSRVLCILGLCVLDSRPPSPGPAVLLARANHITGLTGMGLFCHALLRLI